MADINPVGEIPIIIQNKIISCKYISYYKIYLHRTLSSLNKLICTLLLICILTVSPNADIK